jgi:hypothetical protein
VLTGQNVRTSLKGNYASAELEWDALRRSRGFLGLLVGAKLVDVDVVLLNVDAVERVVDTQRLPIPVLGVTGRVYVHPRLSLEGEFSGLSIGDRGHLWEWLIAGRLHVSDRLAGAVGYHKLSLEGRNDRDSLQLGLGKWTFGVELSL